MAGAAANGRELIRLRSSGAGLICHPLSRRGRGEWVALRSHNCVSSCFIRRESEAVAASAALQLRPAPCGYDAVCGCDTLPRSGRLRGLPSHARRSNNDQRPKKRINLKKAVVRRLHRLTQIKHRVISTIRLTQRVNTAFRFLLFNQSNLRNLRIELLFPG